MTAQQIHDEIVAYLATNFGSELRSMWYVGIASNVDQRLFGEHNVDRKSPAWIWRNAFSNSHARAAESLLLQRGHDGGPGGGDQNCTYVYAFRMDPGTVR